MDIKTLSAVIGHVSSATTLNVYAHGTDGMRQSAAAKTDRTIAKAEPQLETAVPKKPVRTAFQVVKRRLPPCATRKGEMNIVDALRDKISWRAVFPVCD